MPSAESRSQLSELRRLLRSEASALLKDLQRVSALHKTRVEQCLKKLDRGDDTAILSELAELRSVLEAARHGLDRMGMATQSSEKLRTEWNDWERHAGFVEDASHATKRTRQEMIASELRLRGVRLPGSQAVEVVLAVEEGTEGAAEREAAPVPPVLMGVPGSAMEMMEETESEDEVSDAHYAYWDSLVASLPPETTESESLARILAAYRSIQGQQKLQDRARGVRRYRLGAFDAWN